MRNILLSATILAAGLATNAWTQGVHEEELFQPTKLPSVTPGGPSGSSSPLVGGSDNCATPDAISGYSTFAFDNTTATVTADGQSTTNCIFYNQISIDQDVWFLWTAPATARVQISTCGATTVDTKIAVYGSTICPGAGALALVCNDDINGTTATANFQSMLFLDAVAGTQYMIQVGTYPLAGGGTGTISIQAFTPSTTCTHDDGGTENGISVGTAGTLRTTGWLTRLGVVGQNTTVSSISTAWGWTGTGSPLPAGLTGNVGVFEDPNDDGIPTDAVLLGTASALMVGQHTDVLQTINLALPVTASGIYFIAAWTAHTNGFPSPADTSTCAVLPGLSWVVGNAGAILNTTNLGANTNPPFQPGPNAGANGQIGYAWLMRGSCSTSSPGAVFCEGSGTGTLTPCPCANHSAAGAGMGCLNSFGVGAGLTAAGLASLAADSVVLSANGLPAASVLFFQGTTQQNGGNGSTFGDGLRCAGGSIIRLKTYTALGAPGAATSSYPQTGDPSVSVRGSVTTPGTRTYQTWYRNSASFCSASVFNLSNGWQISWSM